ncbi:MAG: PspA/IM30 family protein [Chloroflexota bacterium]
MSSQRSLEIRSQLTEVRRLLTAAMVDEQRLYQRHVEAGREADRWKRRAELALGRGDEDLARAALARSIDHGARASQFQQQYLEQKSYVEGMKARLRAMESGEVMAPPSAARGAGAADLERNIAQLERWEDRAREERARLAAWAELERDELAEKLEALEREEQLGRQLAELKQRLGATGRSL